MPLVGLFERVGLRTNVGKCQHDMQTVPSGRQPVGGGVQTQDDGGGAEVLRETKRAGRVRGLREGDDDRVPGSPSYDTAWEGKGRQVELE